MKIPQDILDIHKKFDEASFDLHLVGGCVRDHLLGIEPKDYDMVTNALPETVEEILKGYKMDFTGKAFGVMRVQSADQPKGYEIATYREDITVGRKPQVKVGVTIVQDAMRRDFTINAMYYDISSGKILDFVGGQEDLKKKLIKTPGKAEDRMNEDRLRIMRAIRFMSRIGGFIDEELGNAIERNNKLIGPDEHGHMIPVAQERITDEFCNGIVQAKRVDKFIMGLQRFDMYDQIFKNIFVSSDYAMGITLPNSIEINLAMLLWDEFSNGKLECKSKLIHELHFPTHVIEGVEVLLGMRDVTEDNAFLLKRKMVKSHLKREDLVSFFDLCASLDVNSKQGAELNENIVKNILTFIDYEITTDGEELKKEGLIGKAIGDEIKNREKINFSKLKSQL